MNHTKTGNAFKSSLPDKYSVMSAIAEKIQLLTRPQLEAFEGIVDALLEGNQVHSEDAPTYGSNSAGNLPPVFHHHPVWAYLICQDWKAAQETDTPHDWAYVAGLLDGINSTHQLDAESTDSLSMLASIARSHMAMAGQEVQS